MEELPHYFAAANVAVYPYDNTLINRTKCSVKLLDLLAAGVPVVASKVGQNVEYIRHGQTGFLVPPDGSSYMANNIFIILNNRQLQHAMGQAAAQHVNRVFNWDLLVEKAEAAYMSLK
jgi:glycosyltransferase involved in cell wall biosynthesis